MKILQLYNRVPWPLNDGGNIAAWNPAFRLKQMGHEVHLAALNTSKHFVDSLDEAGKAYQSVTTVNIDTDVTVPGLAASLFQKFPYNVSRFWSDEFVKKLEQLFRENYFDIVQIEGAYMGMYNAEVRKGKQGKLVLRSHNVEHQIWERFSTHEKNPLKKKYLAGLARKIKAFEIKTLSEYDAILAITPEDAAWYRTHNNKAIIEALPAGADIPPAPEVKPDTASICFLGSLEWMPNQQGLLWFVQEVWPKVFAKHPEVKLHIAGKNPPEDMSAKLSRPGVVFHGMVPDAVAFMQSHAMMVVPLFSGGGMRLKVVEAMGAGMCIVSTRLGAEGIRCTDGEHLLFAEDAAQWVAALDALLRTPQRAAALGEAARGQVRDHYSWEALAQQQIRFYEKVLSAENI